jgi:MFS family permease
MMALAFGMMMGPVISTAVYPYFGYSGTFYFFAVFIFVFGLGPLFFVPSRINQVKDKKASLDKSTLEPVNFGTFIKNKYALLTLFTLLGSMICINWTIPTLSNEMVDHHSPPMNKGNAGLSFAICACTAGIGSPFIGKLCKYIHRKYIAAAGLFLLSIGLFLTGPSEYLHIPNKLWIIFVGLGVCGFANAMVLVTAIPELIY